MNKIKRFLIGGMDVFKKNKSRSLMTVFGISVGIAMVILVLSAGNAVSSIVLGEISSFGDNWVNIEIKIPSAAKNSRENSAGIAQGVQITSLTLEDKDAITRMKNIDSSYGGITAQASISRGVESERVTVFGVTSEYFSIAKGSVTDGYTYTAYDDERNSQVVVLGSSIAEQLFSNQNPIDEQVRIDGKNYTVVGVMEPLGVTGFMDMDMIAYIPASTVQQKILGVRHLMWIVGDVADGANPLVVSEEIRALLRDRHTIDDPEKEDFAVTTYEESVEIVSTILFGITWLLVALSAISLAVGGVGIMNIMYVSVAERTFEIGLRKSIGATNKDIQQQFLSEAVVITSIGGLLGVATGVTLSFLISFGATKAGISWPFSISIFSLFLSVGFSTLVGLVFGYYPAKQASELDPIVALRAE